MFTISIDKKINLEGVDALYESLNRHVNLEIKVNLQLPNVLDNDYWGLIPALYQFSITWARSPYASNLILDIENPDMMEPNYFLELYENEFLFPIISFVWNNNEIVNKDGISLRKYLKPANVDFFDRMRKTLPMKKGPKLLLTSFDHLPLDRALLPCFETIDAFIRDESKVAANITPSFSRLLMHSNEARRRFDHVKEPILGIIYELMKNTYEWAKDNEKHIPLNPNIRGLYIKFFKKKREVLIDTFNEHKGLKEYFSSKTHNENSLGELYFLEISVFDSGIGFIKRYASNNGAYADNNPIDIVKKCLLLRNTSARGISKDDKGVGLDKTLQCLDKRGFIRIKTGDVCVYRNMITHNHKDLETTDVDGMKLFDWDKNSDQNYTEFKHAEGSVITIIFPLSISPMII